MAKQQVKKAIPASDPRYKKMTPAQRNANTVQSLKDSFKMATPSKPAPKKPTNTQKVAANKAKVVANKAKVTNTQKVAANKAKVAANTKKVATNKAKVVASRKPTVVRKAATPTTKSTSNVASDRYKTNPYSFSRRQGPLSEGYDNALNYFPAEARDAIEGDYRQSLYFNTEDPRYTVPSDEMLEAYPRDSYVRAYKKGGTFKKPMKKKAPMKSKPMFKKGGVKKSVTKKRK